MMSKSWVLFIFLMFSINHSIEGTYHYAGCFTQVFHETFFTSSYMEPTLCFRLCDTPIIYLQKTICRCSGGGLMHHNRQQDTMCSIPCTKPADRQVNTSNTCGGPKGYSAYVEDKFYLRHGHLFQYQINFFACEVWNDSSYYEIIKVNLNEMTSSLNTMERCAAACLDRNATTRLIAFNGYSLDECVCITSWKPYSAFSRANYITTLSNTACDFYCNITSKHSKAENKFPCGSLDNTRVWAVYDINGSCPKDFLYIKDLKKCFSKYRSVWSSCTLPSKSFVYDNSITWDNFLKMIQILQLNETYVTVDFDTDVIVSSLWKCPSTTTSNGLNPYNSRSNLGYYNWNINTRYVLDSGCLRESSYSSYTHRYSYRLCVANPIDKYSFDDGNNATYFINSIDPITKFCPKHWFDLNGKCYRMSDEKKTFSEARNNCITVSKNEKNPNDESDTWSIADSEDEDTIDDDEQLNSSPKGDIVLYIAEWQARLGFFLLDTVSEGELVPVHTSSGSNKPYYEDLISLDFSGDVHFPTVNDFQMLNSTENNSSNTANDLCMISTRGSVDNDYDNLEDEEEEETTEERPIIKSISTNNCSTPRHVLCETKTLIIRNFQKGCFRKPLTMDLPALISNRLTYELCLSVCQELQTKLAIIHIDKCYCVNGFNSRLFNLTTDLVQYQQDDCGYPCPGNLHEQCGQKEIVIIFHILDSRRTYSDARTPAEPFPDFVYDSCIQIDAFNSSTTYQFNLNDKKNVHPRHCLELCTSYQQKYALMNSDKCFCTNTPLKNDEYGNEMLPSQHCSQRCSGNYFYSCGNLTNSTIYSMYVMQPKCRHGFEVAENDQQCVYSHFSTKKSSFSIAESYCKSIGGVIAKVKDILEILDILPESILYTRLSKYFPLFYNLKFTNDTRYFWIGRTSDISAESTKSDRLLGECSQRPKEIEENCLVIQHENIPTDNITISQRCVAQSNQCSTMLAIPVCVDQHIENDSTIIPITSNDISSKTTIDYSCGNDTNYHFIDDYCYKITHHEKSWNDAKAECEQENAMLFVPEKSITLQIVKSLFLHRNSYTSSGFAHVGVMYDNKNRTVIQYNKTNESTLQFVPDSNAVYDLCEKTFHERYSALMVSSSLSMSERNKLKTLQKGCAYMDLLSYTVPIIRCDEIPCNRIAAVICQKLPNIETDVINAKRKTIEIPTTPNGIPTDDDDDSSLENSDINSSENTKSIGRDYAPIFFILAVLFSLVLLGSISTLHNHRVFQKKNNNITNHTGRRNNNSVYSQLTSADEFDLN